MIPKYRFKVFRERLKLACPSNLGRDKTELYDVYLPSYSGSYLWEKSQPVLYLFRASS